jgi:hypothetical protein
MSTKINIAAAAAFLAVVTAPQLASAQLAIVVPPSADQPAASLSVPSDARAQAGGYVRQPARRAAPAYGAPAYGWTAPGGNVWLDDQRDPHNDR